MKNYFRWLDDWSERSFGNLLLTVGSVVLVFVLVANVYAFVVTAAFLAHWVLGALALGVPAFIIVLWPIVAYRRETMR